MEKDCEKFEKLSNKSFSSMTKKERIWLARHWFACPNHRKGNGSEDDMMDEVLDQSLWEDTHKLKLDDLDKEGTDDFIDFLHNVIEEPNELEAAINGLSNYPKKEVD